MRSEDSEERFLRLLKEQRDGIIDRVSRGRVSTADEPGNYRDLTGQVTGLDFAIQVCEECFFGKKPPEPERSTLADLYGVGDLSI